MGGGRQILKLLAGEDIDGDNVDLGVTVLASLRGGHVDDLAGAALDDDVTVLPQSRALHGEGGGRAGIRRVEGDVVLFIALVGLCSNRASVFLFLSQEGLAVVQPKRGEPQDAGLQYSPASHLRGWAWESRGSKGAESVAYLLVGGHGE